MLHELQDICKCRGSSRPAPNYLNGDLARGSTDNGFMLHSATSFNTVSSQDFLSWLLLHTIDSVDQTLLLYSQGGHPPSQFEDAGFVCTFIHIFSCFCYFGFFLKFYNFSSYVRFIDKDILFYKYSFLQYIFYQHFSCYFEQNRTIHSQGVF